MIDANILSQAKLDVNREHWVSKYNLWDDEGHEMILKGTTLYLITQNKFKIYEYMHYNYKYKTLNELSNLT